MEQNHLEFLNARLFFIWVVIYMYLSISMDYFNPKIRKHLKYDNNIIFHFGEPHRHRADNYAKQIIMQNKEIHLHCAFSNMSQNKVTKCIFLARFGGPEGLQLK